VTTRSAVAYNALGIGLLRLGHVVPAVENFERALAISPDSVDAHNNLAAALMEQGRIEDALEHSRQALALDPSSAVSHSTYLLGLHYSANYSPAVIRAAHAQFAARFATPPIPLAGHARQSRDPNRRLRVGYVSADFRAHSVAYFIEPVLKAHDRRLFEVTCYANVAQPDWMTARLRGHADHWRSVANTNDEDLAAQIQSDRIDILVDLAGHTAGNRLLAFARKPAPVQVTYLGYPDTTGLAAMDFRVTDAWADPVGETELLYSEELSRLPSGFLCYQPPPDAPEPSHVGSRGRVTFGFLNELSKVNERVISRWAAILRRTPQSKLLIKAVGLSHAQVRERILRQFEDHAVPAERLDLRGRLPSVVDHMRVYNEVDIVLDSFPYNATTTNCEALWMSVPFVTLAGRSHVSRVGTSLLSRLGLRELIAQSEEDYVDIAVDLAADASRLDSLHATLRERMAASTLCDAARVTHSLEDAYRAMWQRCCESSVGHGSPLESEVKLLEMRRV
jgi:protein O-GlcNAc transferase